MQGDEHFHEELFVLHLQRQSKTINDAENNSRKFQMLVVVVVV